MCIHNHYQKLHCGTAYKISSPCRVYLTKAPVELCIWTICPLHQLNCTVWYDTRWCIDLVISSSVLFSSSVERSKKSIRDRDWVVPTVEYVLIQFMACSSIACVDWYSLLLVQSQ